MSSVGSGYRREVWLQQQEHGQTRSGRRRGSVSFLLWLLAHVITDLVLVQQKCTVSQWWKPEAHHPHLWAKIRVLAGPRSLEALERLFPASASLWWLPAVFGLWLHHSRLKDQHLQILLLFKVSHCFPLERIHVMH